MEDKELMDMGELADYLALSYRYTRENLTKRPDFPRPYQVVPSPQGRRWAKEDIIAWLEKSR
jgi:predicted DNA-binding transcriptional regulator AlpA